MILVAPTAIGDTWSLMEPQVIAPHLARMLEQVAHAGTSIRSRLLLTGMSDGGTFTLLSGLDERLAVHPSGAVAAGFHPLLLTMADADAVRGLPVYLVHGALDWMFPVSGRTQPRGMR